MQCRLSVYLILCSIIQKASNALEVLKEVLDAVDSQHPEVCCWSTIVNFKLYLKKSQVTWYLSFYRFLFFIFIHVCKPFMGLRAPKERRKEMVFFFFSLKYNDSSLVKIFQQ